MVPYCGEETTRNVLAAYKPKPKDVLREGPSAAVAGLFARAHTLQLVSCNFPFSDHLRVARCSRSSQTHAYAPHTATQPQIANSDGTPGIWRQLAAILHSDSKTGVVRAKIRKIGHLARRVMCR